MAIRKLKILKWTLIGFLGITVLTIGLMALFIRSLFADPDLSNAPAYHPFKSAKAKQAYLAYYDKRAQEWPVASDTRYVKTSFGLTFVRISGKPGSPNLVLLPSANATSLIWMHNIADLSQSYRVYAVDNIYDVGRSVYIKVMKRPDDLVLWLDDLCTGLELGDSINLMGYSHGGWIASQYALKHPERLEKVVLIAPAATVCPLPGEWAWRGILSALPHRIFMEKLMVDWLFADLAGKKDPVSRAMLDNAIADAMMTLKSFRFKMPVAPTVLSDDELRRIRTPTLFLVGEHEKIYAPLEAIERLSTVAPKIKTEMIKGAGHDLPLVQAQAVNKRVLEFLEISK